MDFGICALPRGNVEISLDGSEWKSVMMTDYIEYSLNYLMKYPKGTNFRYNGRDITDMVEKYRREHDAR